MDTSEKHEVETNGVLSTSFANRLQTLKRLLEHGVVSTVSILVLLVIPVIYVWLSWARWVIAHFEQVVADQSDKESSVAIERILPLAGTFGDLFGGINALFTGVGLAFLIYTIFQQSKMIHQQQVAIDQQNVDLRNQKTAAERSQALQSMLQIRAVLQDEETRKAREIVLSGVGASKDPQLLARVLLYELEFGSTLSVVDNQGRIEEQSLINDVVINKDKTLILTKTGLAILKWHRAAERVLDSYNYLGILWFCNHFGEDDKKVLMETWGPSINRCHNLLVGYCGMDIRPNDIDREMIEKYLLGTTIIPKEKLKAISYSKFNRLAEEYVKTYQSNGGQSDDK
jgi:hypothetical protein